MTERTRRLTTGAAQTITTRLQQHSQMLPFQLRQHMLFSFRNKLPRIDEAVFLRVSCKFLTANNLPGNNGQVCGELFLQVKHKLKSHLICLQHK